MALVLNLPTNAEVEARLNKYKNWINLQRVDRGDTPFVTTEEMLVDHLKRVYPIWLREMFADEVTMLNDAYVKGTDAQQQAARDAFGI